MNTLRGRLLLSYVLLVGLCLAIIAVALFLILRRNALPERATYLRLNDIARASMPILNATLTRDPEALQARLAEIAATSEVRTLLVADDGSLLFDSAGTLQGQPVPIDVGAPGSPDQPRRGRFADPDGQVWLYVITNPRHHTGSRIVFAAPRRRLPALALLGVNLLSPLVQAGLIALIASIVLAALISGSVARPLRRIAGTAGAIARGEYDQKAPVEGPAEVRDLARAFNDMVARVKSSQAAQRDFLANVSHELKTPLTSIQGFSQAILDGAERDPAHAARVIHDEAGRMRRMVEELLDLARIESGQVVMARQHLDLAAILNAVVERLSLRAAESEVELVATISQLPPITGDGDRLAQVFTNLIDNALDHTPRGGRVAVSAAPADRSVHVAVSDTGPGIPAEDLSRIFERFYQVDKSRARDGPRRGGKRHSVGLGLTITREIVEAHGGVIRAESVEGQGTTFRLWLPLPRAADATVARRR